ncbi:MAG TPA: TerB family tellurite resistance protein [Nocardia sp.]|uniref:tellurite resistance TerB family protein n=1 Tax=Nocardia TaxID=1817 RepID=UPI00245392E0|nr:MULTISPECIES: TerB family tellurite resistance protein [Nocardia]HLS77757.1 TerB family tellurite resistance protein [Nocardia sp.]
MSFINKLFHNANNISRLLDLADKAPQWRKQLMEKKNEFRGGAFRDAVMGMCALVAAADGTIDPGERMRVANLISTEPALDAFPADELRLLFDSNCDRVLADPAFGKTHLMQQITKVAGKPDQAHAVVQIGVMIANADGKLDLAEIHAVREACAALNIPPVLDLPA